MSTQSEGQIQILKMKNNKLNFWLPVVTSFKFRVEWEN